MKNNHHNQMLDPDVRFLLANERTLLAWVRTGLTLQAGGFALTHFADGSLSATFAGIVAILSGGILAIIGYTRFKAADKAIRNHQLPQNGKGPALEVLVVVIVALLLATIQIVSLLVSK